MCEGESLGYPWWAPEVLGNVSRVYRLKVAMISKKNIVSTLAILCLSTPHVVRADIDPDTLATLKTRFAAADKNGDGKLTREECQAGMPRIYRGFDKIDADNKGYITLDQIITFVANR